MADNEHYSPNHPDGLHGMSAELIEAYQHSSYNAQQLYAELKQNDGKFILTLNSLAERFRKEGIYTDSKQAFLIGALTMIIVQNMQVESDSMDAILKLPEYIDEQHTLPDTSSL
jgi:hypothetical protein